MGWGTCDHTIEAIELKPDDTEFLVYNPDHGFWVKNDHGYSNDLGLAKIFSKQEILRGLQNIGFVDKYIIYINEP